MIESTITIPPHGHVHLVDCFGCDQRIVQTARLSYLGESKGEEQDKKLLFYLYKNRHTSPFESSNVTYHIKFPIFLMRQFVRHRTFRLNEWSGRYSELKDEFFSPSVWRAQDNKNRQGSEGEVINQGTCQVICMQAYEHAYTAYQELLRQGVSKEQARMVLPVGIYTEIMVNIDIHNLIHFFRLRLDPHAQDEMREVAQAMYDLVAPLFPWTFEAFHRFKWNLWDNELCEYIS